jgi:hypothetical protein
MTSTTPALTHHFPDLSPSVFFSGLSVSRTESDLLALEVSFFLSTGRFHKVSKSSSPQQNLTLEPTLEPTLELGRFLMLQM